MEKTLNKAINRAVSRFIKSRVVLDNGTAVRKSQSSRAFTSPAQQLLNTRMKFAANFLNKGSWIFRLGYQSVGNANWYSKMIGHLLKDAVVGDESCLSVDFSRLKVSSGTMQNVSGAQARPAPGGLEFNWLCAGNDPHKNRVEVIAAVYLPLQDVWLNCRTKKADGSMSLLMPLNGDQVLAEAYIFCLDEKAEKVSSSTYLGTHII